MARRVSSRLRRLALLSAALACLSLPCAALAHHTGAAADGVVPPAVEQVLGGEVTELPDGLYEVDPRRGPDLTTHGPDTQPEIRFDHGSNFGPGDPERPPVCATDYYQQVLYARPASAPNDFAASVPLIQATMRRINAALNEESLESGGVSADYKVLCDGSGAVRVDQFVVNSGTSFSAVVSAARSAGFDEANVDYTILFDYDHPSVCGVGSYASDESLSAANANNTGGDYGVTYDGCWNGTTTMHENGHNQGAVQYNAPFSTGSGGHCWDENDVMCYSPDGGDLHQQGTISRCIDWLHFDCGNDDYFDSAPENGEYLATHWNLGSRLNCFIAFGDVAPGSPSCGAGSPEAPPPAPTPDPGSSGGAPGAGDGSGSQRLANRVPFSDSSAARGGWRLYTVKVPRNRARLAVTLDCALSCPDQLDLYLRGGAGPTLSTFDCRAATPGSDESCRIRLPHRGTWHVGVHTAAGAGGAAFEITARIRR